MSVRPRLALPFLIALSALLTASAAPAGWRDKPGAFDYYVLVLGCAQSYCRNEGRFRHDGECGASKPRAFILHGLWPQYAKGWPEDCPTGKRPWVPSHVIDEMRDLMPSKISSSMNTARTEPARTLSRRSTSAWRGSFTSA